MEIELRDLWAIRSDARIFCDLPAGDWLRGVDHLSRQTGLTRELPDAVDKYTPQGRLPDKADFERS